MSTPPTSPNALTTRFQKVQSILAAGAGGSHPDHDGHGRFWELPLAEFVALTIYGVKLIAEPGANRGANSGLIKALKGELPFDGSMFDRMPLGRPPVSPADMQFIQSWIDDGCPDDPLPTAPVQFVSLAPSTGAVPPPRPVIALRSPNPQLGAIEGVKVRKNIDNLQPNELANLRLAFSRLAALPDTDHRSYRNQANIHRDYCDSGIHNSQLFLPWHRAYLYLFELLLQDMVAGVTLPYWDWMSNRAIPAAYAEETVDGQQNPLYHAARDFDPGALPSTTDYNNAQNALNYRSYGGGPRNPGLLENPPHNQVHGAVGLDMGSTNTAATDPMFWAHHANVDRLWAEWQKTHDGSNPPNLDDVLRPFTLKVRDVLSIGDLGFSYAKDATLFKTNKAVGLALLATGPAGLSTSVANANFHSAQVKLHNVLHPVHSFELRVFLNQPGATADTPIEGNEHYAGRFVFFGHGECIGGPGHCEPAMHEGKFDLRAPSMAPFDLILDVTDSVRKMVAGTSKDIEVKFVAAGRGAEQATTLQVDAISLALED